MLELLVNGKALDFYRDTSIPLELNNFVFQGINELFKSHSYNFNLPKSKNNQRILGFPEMLDTDSDSETVVCTVLWNGIEIFEGDLVLAEPGTGDYEVNLQGKLKTELSNLELQMGIPASATNLFPYLEVNNSFWEGIINNDSNRPVRRGRGENDTSAGAFGFNIAFYYMYSALLSSLSNSAWEFELNWDTDLNNLVFFNQKPPGGTRYYGDNRYRFPDNTTYLELLDALTKLFCLYVQPDKQNKKILVGHCQDLLDNLNPQIIKNYAAEYFKSHYEGNKGYTFDYANTQEVALEDRQDLYEPYQFGGGENPITSTFSFLPNLWEMDSGFNPRVLLFFDDSDNYVKYTGPNFSLRWGDLVPRFWEKWLNFLATTKLVKRNIFMSATQLAALDFTRPIQLDGLNFFVKQLRTNIKANHDKRLHFVVQAELFLIK